MEYETSASEEGKILYALANCPLNPEFRIAYAVKDQEAAKNTLLGTAVKEAMEKAEAVGEDPICTCNVPAEP